MPSEIGFIYSLLGRVKSAFSFMFSSFFGSETQKPYSEGYIWVANQFSHFFIGFGGLFLLTWIASYYLRKPVPSHTYNGHMIDPRGLEPVKARTVWGLALFWLLIWLSKEWLVDYRNGSELAFYFVDSYLSDLIWDSATDCFFYIAGMAVALAHFGMLPITPIPLLLIVLLLSVSLATYWVPARERLETTGTPYFIRLNSNDLGLDATFNELTRKAFFDQFLKDDKVGSTGVEPAVRKNTHYPFQFLMDAQLNKKQILAAGGTRLIPRFFIAIANERVVRQAVGEPCDTRFITFRDLLNSKVTKKTESGATSWGIETITIPKAEINDPACPIEDAELLIVDQTPIISVAATLIGELVTFVESDLNETKTLPPLLAEESTRKLSDIAAAIRAVDPDETKRRFETFFRALSTKTVIWVLDNKSVAEEWSASLQSIFPDQSIGLIEFEALR